MNELTIEKVVYGGAGLARLPERGGRRQVVFLPGTLPGERVLAELDPPRVIKILQPSPDRVEPACEYFGRCGGCQMQHASYAAQVAIKREVLVETLQRTGGVAWTGPITMHTAHPWGYRNRIRLHRSGAGWGYFESGSHRVLPISHCPIADPELSAAIPMLANDAGHEIELALASFSAAGLEFRVSDGSFFQVNRFLASELVEAVTGGQEGGTAIDLFSGVGLFALPLAPRFDRVFAVEGSPAAVDDLRWNAKRSANIEVVASSAVSFFRRQQSSPDLVIADPPRAGLGKELVQALITLAPARVHIVSCDPATLGRDLKPLVAHGYTLEEVHLFDLFPQTFHLETVVKLQRI
ncbi:MAG TPA: class I SAM-dependent RNA methyltransferase [Terriglobales bacterium]|nr:class I SAM-dependent RNA methyltransferase [Terriglobales bacterium]